MILPSQWLMGGATFSRIFSSPTHVGNYSTNGYDINKTSNKNLKIQFMAPGSAVQILGLAQYGNTVKM